MLKLGKAPATPDRRDLLVEEFVDLAALPLPPATFGHGFMFHHGADWLMLGNGPDQSVAPGFAGAGCCVWSMAAHIEMEVSKLAGHAVTFSGKNVIADYADATGYRIGDDSTDQGTDMRTALGYRRATGIIDAHGTRHKIGAYLALRPGDWGQLMQAAYVFSATELGIQFPASAMDQFNQGAPWDVVDGSPIEGGHAIAGMGRSSRSVAGVITWGRRQAMTRHFYESYCDEAWVVVYPSELNAKGVNERGLNVDQLNEALHSL